MANMVAIADHQRTTLYQGLSDEARELRIKRMARTLSRKPRNRKTREYVKTLTGKPETEAELRARAYASAEKVIRAMEAGGHAPIIRRVRKDRVSPMAAKSEQRHRTKHCRRASRYQLNFVAEGPRLPRDLEEMRETRRKLYAVQGGLCAICGHPMNEDPLRASIDHVIPHALGGKGGLGNYVATHGECNGDKTNDAPTGCEMVWLLMVNAKLGVKPDVF